MNNVRDVRSGRVSHRFHKVLEARQGAPGRSLCKAMWVRPKVQWEPRKLHKPEIWAVWGTPQRINRYSPRERPCGLQPPPVPWGLTSKPLDLTVHCHGLPQLLGIELWNFMIVLLCFLLTLAQFLSILLFLHSWNRDILLPWYTSDVECWMVFKCAHNGEFSSSFRGNFKLTFQQCWNC